MQRGWTPAVARLDDLFFWQLTQLATYAAISFAMRGHQNTCWTRCSVLKVPIWPLSGVSCSSCKICVRRAASFGTCVITDRSRVSALSTAPTFANVQDIVLSRCSMCHGAEPVWESIVTAPKGILLDAPEHIRRNARLIGRNAAWSNAMPPGNVTEMTTQERALIAAWLAADGL